MNLTFRSLLGRYCYGPQFTEKETEALRGHQKLENLDHGQLLARKWPPRENPSPWREAASLLGEIRAFFAHLSFPAKGVGPALPHLWSLILLYVSLPSPNALLHRVL